MGRFVFFLFEVTLVAVIYGFVPRAEGICYLRQVILVVYFCFFLR